MSQNEAINIVKIYINRLIHAGIPIEKAFLYGSYARQEEDENSDIDVMLVSSAFDSTDLENRLTAWAATREIDIRIEPYTVGYAKYLHDEISPLLQIVRKEGIEIEIA